MKKQFLQIYTRFLQIAPETTKEQDKLYKTMALKTFHIKQQKKEIPERWGTNEMCPIIAPAFCLEKFPGHRSGRGNADRAEWTP